MDHKGRCLLAEGKSRCWRCELLMEDDRYRSVLAPVPAQVSHEEAIRKLLAESSDVVQIEATANGIGDHILGLSSVAGLKRDRPQCKVIMACKPWCLPWVEFFEGPDLLTTNLIDGIPVLRPFASYGKQVSERSRRPRWEYYAEACRTRAELPRARRPGRSALRWARPHVGYVVLSPWSTDVLRTWSMAHWRSLETLLAQRGLQSIVIDNRRERPNVLTSPRLVNQTPSRIAALFYLATAVIGNDSGMAHVAAMLRTPTVVLTASFAGEKIFGIYPTARVVQGPLFCGDCHGRDWPEEGIVRNQIGCNSTCFNLQAITPERVMAALEELIDWPARSHTLLSPDRLAVLRRLSRECATLEGDYAELGCYQGGSARTIAQAAPGKLLHLFDTFHGLPADDIPGGKHKQGEFACSLGEVQKLLAGQKVAYHQGVFPHTAETLASSKFAFVHLDGDLYHTTRDALAFFWPRMVRGGMIVLDDYGWQDCPGVARAAREVLPDVSITELAAHQGVLRKHGG